MNHWTYLAIALAWSQLVQVTLTIGAVWLIVRICARHRPRLAYLLWMLVVIKCITPPIWSSHLGLFSWITFLSSSTSSSVLVANSPAESVWIRSGNTALIPGPSAASRDAPEVLPSGTWIPSTALANVGSSSMVALLPGVWLVGVFVIAGHVLWRWKHFQRSLQSERKTLAVEAQVRNLAARISLKRVPRVVSTSLPTVPAVYGFLRPTIVLPELLLTSGADVDLEPILAHELVHLRRADTLAGRLQLIVQALWWFHPLVWWANFEARRERERSCDETVIELMKYDPRRYAGCLVRIAELSEEFRAGGPHWQPAGVAAIGSFRLLANRLDHIMAHATAWRRHLPWIDVAAVALVAAILLPGSASSLVSQQTEVLATDSNDHRAHVHTTLDVSDRNFNAPFVRAGSDQQEAVAHAPVLEGIVIDGKLEDWPAAMPRHGFTKILADGSKGWEGTDFSTSRDLSCAFMVGYSPETQVLYVAVVVRDDKVIVGQSSHRDTDAMELYVDGLRSRRFYPWTRGMEDFWYEKGNPGLRDLPVQQYCAIPGAGPVYGSAKSTNPLLIAGDLEATKTKMAFTRMGDIITYEWAVQVFDHYPDQPTTLEPGKRIGFEIAVIDRDVPLKGNYQEESERDRPAWIYWGPDWNGTKVFNAASLGEVVLDR